MINIPLLLRFFVFFFFFKKKPKLVINPKVVFNLFYSSFVFYKTITKNNILTYFYLFIIYNPRIENFVINLVFTKKHIIFTTQTFLKTGMLSLFFNEFFILSYLLKKTKLILKLTTSIGLVKINKNYLTNYMRLLKFF
jgi:hypothetical protein